MSFKKFLGIISIVIVLVFSMMLTTSYAWYSFETASTTFNGVTNNDDIKVSFQKGEYINTSTAIPISSGEVDTFADKNTFSIAVKESSKRFELAVTISLTEITIDSALKNGNFRVELLYQNNVVKTILGTNITKSSLELVTQTLDSNIVNDFALRVYVLDDGTNQTTMMNKNFSAKININVVSRLKTSKRDYSGADILVSNISIDGEEKNYLPTEGYYNMTYSCTKGSVLSWEPLSKTLTYNAGSYIGDDCSLSFTSADENTDYPLLSEMPVGSYVKFVGNNGCSGKACEGYNANYVSDTDMGYCYDSNYKFHVNGWRIAYIEDGSAHLVSAGAPECVATYVESKTSSTSNASIWSTNYYYGSGYKFDKLTGNYSLTGVTDSTLALGSNYESIIANYPYTCKATSSTATCNTMYEVASSTTSSKVYYYRYYHYDSASGATKHIEHLNKVALTYCNEKYIKNGICDETTAWAMNATDFKKITGSTLSYSSCYVKYSNMPCGYTNDLVDNGGYYWFAAPYIYSSNYSFYWNPHYRYVGNDRYSSNVIGVRPVLHLSSTVNVTGGTGTMLDPFVIDVG